MVQIVYLQFNIINMFMYRIKVIIYRQFIIKKICINKSTPRKPTIWRTVFPKPKTNFLPTVVTIFFISNKTCYTYFKWRNCRGKRLL